MTLLVRRSGLARLGGEASEGGEDQQNGALQFAARASAILHTS